MSFISMEQAVEIAKEFACEIAKMGGDSLIAVFAIGSLGGGYYRPGQSDIDTLIIVDDSKETLLTNKISEDKMLVDKIADEYQNKYNIPKGFGSIVISKNQLYPPYNKTDELVLEIINLKAQGLLLYGNFDTDSIPMPDRNAIIEDAKAFEDWWDESFINSKQLLSITACSNSILILLKRYLLIEKGIVEFNKLKVIDTYLHNNPPVVNKEIFELINNYIDGKVCEDKAITEQQLDEMNSFHRELRLTMNRLLLNR